MKDEVTPLAYQNASLPIRTTTTGKSECMPRSTENIWSANTPKCPRTSCMPCELIQGFKLQAGKVVQSIGLGVGLTQSKNKIK